MTIRKSKVVVGDYEITSESESYEYRVQIDEFIVHEDFGRIGYVNYNPWLLNGILLFIEMNFLMMLLLSN